MESEQLALQPSDMGIISRIIGIIFSPGKTFRAIQKKPNWLIPAILLVIITLGFSLVTKPILLKETEAQVREQLIKQNLTPAQIEQAIERMQKTTNIMIFVGPTVGYFIILFVLAAVWLFIANTILGGNATYSQILGVNVYKDVLGILAMVVKLPIMLIQNTMNIHFSLATFLPDTEQSTFFYKILSKVEVFNIWMIIVLSIGIGVMSRTSTKKAWPWVAMIFIIWYLATTGLTSLVGK